MEENDDEAISDHENLKTEVDEEESISETAKREIDEEEDKLLDVAIGKSDDYKENTETEEEDEFGKASRAMEELEDVEKWWHLLYDVHFMNIAQDPSLTLEFALLTEEIQGERLLLQKMIRGTFSAPIGPYFLVLDAIPLPSFLLKRTNWGMAKSPEFDHTYQKVLNSRELKVSSRYSKCVIHAGSVNRARFMPQNADIVASKANTAEAFVFDFSKRSSLCDLDSPCDPDLRLKGHNGEGFGLSWNNFREGYLLSGSLDCKICIWDINATPQDKDLNALHVYEGNSFIEDVAWHTKSQDIFGSVGYKNLHIWDARTLGNPVVSVVAHRQQVICLAFNPINEWYLLTGSRDSTVKLFDLRKPSTAVNTFDHHKDWISKVGWHPTNEYVFASSSFDRKIMFWDYNRTSPDRTKDLPQELIFVHRGSVHRIADFSWNTFQADRCCRFNSNFPFRFQL